MKRLPLILVLAALVLAGCQQPSQSPTQPGGSSSEVAQLPTGYQLVNFGAPW